MRIEICGGIASGKTTLAQLIAEAAVQAHFERFQSNPFFEKFYVDPTGFAFETEITYLLQHFSQIREQKDNQPAAFDFSLALDLAYAQVTLPNDADKAVFEHVLARCLEKVGVPQLIIKLDCSGTEELRRIHARHRAAEQSIQHSFLDDLNGSLAAALKRPWFSDVPVLRIDSQELDFREGGADRERVKRLIEAALRHQPGRIL